MPEIAGDSSEGEISTKQQKMPEIAGDSSEGDERYDAFNGPVHEAGWGMDPRRKTALPGLPRMQKSMVNFSTYRRNLAGDSAEQN